MTEKLLEVDNLKIDFLVRSGSIVACNNVSFYINKGECLGLVGESGSGKSTMGLAIMGLLPPSGRVVTGKVLLSGKDITELDESEMRKIRGKDVSMIFQDPMTSLNPTMTIGKQVSETIRIHRLMPKKQAAGRALDVLNLVGIPNPRERMDSYPHQLSGGLRQRVMIAIALAADPSLLIADEPTTALDVTIQLQILDLLKYLCDELSMALLLITHDMGVIAGRTDRVIVMYAGGIVEEASTMHLFSETCHPYTEALLQAIPHVNQEKEQPLYTIPGSPPELSRLSSGCRFEPRCRYATDRCLHDEPKLREVKIGHGAACFYPLKESIKVRGVESCGDLGVVTIESDKVDTNGLEVYEKKNVEGQKSPILVQVDHLIREYPLKKGGLMQHRLSVKAVSDVSFTVNRGETFGLVGESGCGKSTLGRLIAALDTPTAGSIRIDGEKLLGLGARELRRRRRDVQFMFQDPSASLDPRMRVGAIIREPLIIQGIGDRRQQQSKVASLLQEVGLSPHACELYPHELSGGQRQRIGLARTLALNPRLVVADEPVSALDVSIQSQILNLMKDLQKRHGLTYLVISHDLAVLHYLADSIGVMYLGKLVEIGRAEEVYGNIAHPYTNGLMSAIPVPDPAADREKSSSLIFGELPSPVDPPSGCRFRTRCPLAEDICSVEEPPMQNFGGTHFAACHFPLIPVNRVQD